MTDGRGEGREERRARQEEGKRGDKREVEERRQEKQGQEKEKRTSETISPQAIPCSVHEALGIAVKFLQARGRLQLAIVSLPRTAAEWLK